MTEYSYRKRSMERKLRKKRRLTVIGIALAALLVIAAVVIIIVKVFANDSTGTNDDPFATPVRKGSIEDGVYIENIAVGGSRTFDNKRILYRVELCFDSVVRIDDCIVNVLECVRKLSRFNLFELNVLRVLGDVVDRCGDAYAVLELYVALFLKKEQRSCFIGGVVRNRYCDIAAF